MKHWSAEFRPRSICNYGGDSDSGPSGDSGGGYTGDTAGDFFGSSDGGFYGTNDSGSFVGGDTAPAATGGDSWTGSEVGAGQFTASDPGSFFGGGGPVSSDTGGGFISGSPDGGFAPSGYDYSGSPYADYGPGPSFGMDPTGGVDFTGSGMGFGYGPGPAGNMGFGNAIGPPGAMTGDFGMQGYGGPTGTGAGPGSTASIGGPQAYAQAPGINGFEGDFGAPPGGAFGMPNQGDVGPQAGPGLLGGPTTVQQGEALNPSLFGPEVTTPDRVAPTDDRTEADPMSVFGPAVTAQAGWFGPSQAQAASRGTDQDIINLSNQISNEQNMFANDFGRTGDLMAQYMATNNPGLMEAMQAAAAQSQGPMGVGLAESTQGKGDRGDTAPVSQAYPGAEQAFPSMSMYNIDPVAPSQGWPGQTETTPTVQGQQSAVPTVDPATVQQGYQQLAEQMNAQQNQQDMMTAQEHGEQGKSGVFGVPAVDPATSKSGYDMLAQQMNEQLSNQNAPLTADMLDAQSRGEQGKGEQLAPWAQNETIGLRPGEDVISSLFPATQGAGGIIGVPGLLSMYADDRSEPSGRPGGSPTGNPTQAGAGPFGPGGPFGPSGSGRPGGDTSGRPGLSITVGNNQYAAGRPGGPGYYQTGGAGIAPGAKGAEYGGMYGPGVATGRAGTNTFGVSSREGAYGFYDPATGLYYYR